MCRDGYRVECAVDGCHNVVTCRGYTLCLECAEGTVEDW